MLNFGDIGKMGNVLKQAMEMKGKMESLKEELANERVEGDAGGGMVRVVMTGKMEVISLVIEPEIVDPAQMELLQTMVQAAINDGVHKAQELVKSKMSDMAGGIDIPGLTS